MHPAKNRIRTFIPLEQLNYQNAGKLNTKIKK